MSARFPTLEEARAASYEPIEEMGRALPGPRPVQAPDAIVEPDELERLNATMREVLAENERLKDKVVDLEARTAKVTAMHNAMVEKQHRDRKAGRRG